MTTHYGIIYKDRAAATGPVTGDVALPGPRLAAYVETYWSMSWALPEGQTVPIRAIASHGVNLLFEVPASQRLDADANPVPILPALVVGIRTAPYHMTLVGRGHIFGVRFLPGGFQPFARGPVSALTDTRVAFPDLFPDAPDVPSRLNALAATFKDQVEEVTRFLDARAPATPPPELSTLATAFRRITGENPVATVQSLCDELAVGERTLQRLFDRFVGVSPKMVLRTHRFQLAVSEIMAGKTVDFAQLALALGYYDQSHFINDFRAITGWSPGEVKGAVGFLQDEDDDPAL